MTLPNRADSAYTAAELTALADLRPTTVVWLLYGGRIDLIHAQQLAGFLEQVRPRVLFRPYANDIPTRDPVAWAETCWTWISATGVEGECLPANEMNLAVEKGSEDWAAQVRWLTAFAGRWRAIAPGVLLHLPALSPSGNNQEGWAAYQAAGLFGLFDVVDAHDYDGFAEYPPVDSGTVLSITEWNGIDPAKYLTSVEGVARDAVYFLLGGTSDQAAYDILKLTGYYASFKGWVEVDPNTTTTPTFEVGTGVQAEMARRGDTPTSDEVYFKNPAGVTQFSKTAGNKGEYTYTFSTNTVRFLAWTP